jgi:hypothetical protein
LEPSIGIAENKEFKKYSLSSFNIRKNKPPKLYSLGGFIIAKCNYHTLISTSTPEGSSNFIRASTVLEEEE